MSSLADIRTALADTLNTLEGFSAYGNAPPKINLPCAVILPAEANYTKAFGRGLDQWDFNLLICVTMTELDLSQQMLDEYVNGFGDNSIREFIFKNRSLGLSDVEAVCTRMFNYLHETSIGGINSLSATLRVEVYSKGYG